MNAWLAALVTAVALAGGGQDPPATGAPGDPVPPAGPGRGPRVGLVRAASAGPGAYALPVPPGAVPREQLRAPHHDYPASDLMVPSGTAVFAAHAGLVVTHRGARCGSGVTVRGEDRHRYVSCHLSVVSVESGARVAAGDVLGLSGESGNAAGVPHLHFHVRDPAGRYLCPQPLLVSWASGGELSPITAARTDGCSFPRDSG